LATVQVYTLRLITPYNKLTNKCFLLGQYPIVPSFRDWEFPHDRIPDSWPQVSTTTFLGRCAISNFSFAVEGAHLVPKNEVLWYQKNDMGRYGDAILNDINNLINIAPLKADLHKCFDDRWFAIVPKVIETTTSHSPQYVTHILRMQAAELWPAYHNITIQHLDKMARPYLFARFAWAILLQVKPFITSGFSRYVIRISTSDEDKIEYKQEHLSGLQLQNYYGGGGSQAATPLKRKTGSVADEDDPVGSSSEDSDVDMDNDWDDMTSEWQQQGKETRKQKSSETTVEEDNRERLLAELKTHLEEVLPGGGDDIPQQG